MLSALFVGFIVLFVTFAVSMERRLDRIARAIEELNHD